MFRVTFVCPVQIPRQTPVRRVTVSLDACTRVRVRAPVRIVVRARGAAHTRSAGGTATTRTYRTAVRRTPSRPEDLERPPLPRRPEGFPGRSGPSARRVRRSTTPFLRRVNPPPIVPDTASARARINLVAIKRHTHLRAHTRYLA